MFDAVTGDTHLLDHSAIEILQVLHTTPVCVERLSQRLADSFAPEDQGRVVEFITASLLKLKGIGLVFDTPV